MQRHCGTLYVDSSTLKVDCFTLELRILSFLTK